MKKSVFTKSQLDAITQIATQAATAAVREVLNAQTPKAAKPQTSKAGKSQTPKSKKSQTQAPAKPKAEFVLNSKTVEATGYLPYSVYTYNRNAAENFGGAVGKTDKGYFVATFKTVAKAQEFAKIAAYDIPDDAYESIKVATANKREVAKVVNADKAMARAVKAVDNIYACSCKGDKEAAFKKAADKYGVKVSDLKKAYKSASK